MAAHESPRTTKAQRAEGRVGPVHERPLRQDTLSHYKTVTAINYSATQTSQEIFGEDRPQSLTKCAPVKSLH
jgi:hypothetical protein